MEAREWLDAHLGDECGEALGAKARELGAAAGAEVERLAAELSAQEAAAEALAARAERCARAASERARLRAARASALSAELDAYAGSRGHLLAAELRVLHSTLSGLQASRAYVVTLCRVDELGREASAKAAAGDGAAALAAFQALVALARADAKCARAPAEAPSGPHAARARAAERARRVCSAVRAALREQAAAAMRRADAAGGSGAEGGRQAEAELLQAFERLIALQLAALGLGDADGGGGPGGDARGRGPEAGGARTWRDAAGRAHGGAGEPPAAPAAFTAVPGAWSPPLWALEAVCAPYALRFSFHFCGRRPTNRLDRPGWPTAHIAAAARGAEARCALLQEALSGPRAGAGARELAARLAPHGARVELLRCLLSTLATKMAAEWARVRADDALCCGLLNECLAFELTLRGPLRLPPRVGGALGAFCGMEGAAERWARLEGDAACAALLLALRGARGWVDEPRGAPHRPHASVELAAALRSATARALHAPRRARVLLARRLLCRLLATFGREARRRLSAARLGGAGLFALGRSGGRAALLELCALANGCAHAREEAEGALLLRPWLSLGAEAEGGSGGRGGGGDEAAWAGEGAAEEGSTEEEDSEEEEEEEEDSEEDEEEEEDGRSACARPAARPARARRTLARVRRHARRLDGLCAECLTLVSEGSLVRGFVAAADGYLGGDRNATLGWAQQPRAAAGANARPERGAQLEVSQLLCAPLAALREQLESAQASLAPQLWRPVWREAAAGIERALLQRLVLAAAFSPHGARQLCADLTALASLFPQPAAAPELEAAPPAHGAGAAAGAGIRQMRRLREAVGLLSAGVPRLRELSAALHRADAEARASAEAEADGAAPDRPAAAAAAARLAECGVRALSAEEVRALLLRSLPVLRQ